MEERDNTGTVPHEKIRKEVPQLIAVLKEMKQGLDLVTSKVEALTTKVKAKQYPTSDGVSYLEAKHLLLINYCQSLVYYLLRKAKGLSIEGHPVVRSLVEIRLFLEKIRPIDKKCGYRMERLLSAASTDVVKVELTENVADATQKSEDLLKYRPNPDMLVSKTDMNDDDNRGVYKPPKIAPTTMEEGRKSKQERDAERKSKDTLRRVRQSEYVRSLVDDLEGRPEEVREMVGAESREFSKFKAQWDRREEQEEEIFNRAPITKAEKRKMKHLMRSNGLLGLTDNFYDEIKALPLGDGADERKSKAGFGSAGGLERKHKKRKKRF